MLISHSGKWIFFACGRTGTTSIEQVLRGYDEGDGVRGRVAQVLGSRLRRPLRPPDIKHARPWVVKEVIGSAWSDYFKFVYVRNPWDWVVSQYFFNLRPGYFKRKAISRLRASDLDRLFQVLASRHPSGVPGNWQSEYAFDDHDNPQVDRICRFERLQEDFDEVCSALHLQKVTLPLTNRADRSDYRRYYDDETRLRVAREFDRDIRLLNYGF